MEDIGEFSSQTGVVLDEVGDLHIDVVREGVPDGFELVGSWHESSSPVLRLCLLGNLGDLSDLDLDSGVCAIGLDVSGGAAVQEELLRHGNTPFLAVSQVATAMPA